MKGLDASPKLPKMELIPPRDAEVEGVFREPTSHHNGRIIYTERVLDVEGTKASAKPKVDAEGNEVWKRHPTTGEAQYPMLVKETKFKNVRYVLHGQEVGRHVKKVYNFEPTPEELAELDRREKEREFQNSFSREAAASGMTAADLIARIKADTLAPGEDADAVDLDLTEEVVEERMAAADEGAMMQRDDEEGASGVTDDEKPKSAKRGRKRK